MGKVAARKLGKGGKKRYPWKGKKARREKMGRILGEGKKYILRRMVRKGNEL